MELSLQIRKEAFVKYGNCCPVDQKDIPAGFFFTANVLGIGSNRVRIPAFDSLVRAVTFFGYARNQKAQS